MTVKKFFYDGSEGSVTLYTYDILGNRVDLYGINTLEEAEEVCQRLNASIVELMGEEGPPIGLTEGQWDEVESLNS